MLEAIASASVRFFVIDENHTGDEFVPDSHNTVSKTTFIDSSKEIHYNLSESFVKLNDDGSVSCFPENYRINL
jgi:hypothetical protein